jgi:hypothetical protein
MATGRVPTTANSPLTAKGDLFTYSTAPARLAVGNDGETIVADSSTSTGLRWQGDYAAGKNKIINGDFGVWQRGTSLSLTTNAGAYLADRFLINWAGTFTGTISQQTFTPGTAPVAGYEGQFFNRIVRTGTTSVAPSFYQRVENVRTFAGQAVTFSFWAKADAARSVGIQVYQSFGTGGSAGTDNNAGTASLTTSWQRFSFTYTVPSVSGKTITTAGDSWMAFYLSLPDSTAFTIDTWGFQMEAGSVATAFQTATGTIQGETSACQRYYQFIGGTTNSFPLLGGYIGSETLRVPMIFPVQMRVAPTITKNGTWNAVGIGQPSAQYINTQGFSIEAAGTGGGFYLHPNSTDDTFTISAEL